MGVSLPAERASARVRRILLDHVSFNTPRARVLNLVSILALLASLPTDRLRYLPVRSLFESVFHVRPYSSGIMRALSRLLHGDLAGALEFNKLVVLVFFIMVAIILSEAVTWYRRRHRPSRRPA